MFTHPEIVRELAKDHLRTLIADADAHRVLAAARRHRHTRRSDGGSPRGDRAERPR